MTILYSPILLQVTKCNACAVVGGINLKCDPGSKLLTISRREQDQDGRRQRTGRKNEYIGRKNVYLVYNVCMYVCMRR